LAPGERMWDEAASGWQGLRTWQTVRGETKPMRR